MTKLKFILRILILCNVSIFAIPSFSASADEVDNIVNALNEELSSRDYSGFAEAFAESVKRDKRFGKVNFDALENNTKKTVKTLDVYGDYVSHSVMKKEYCGDRIARVISVFFSEDGQFAINYWFMKSGKEWAATTFGMHGESNTGTFFKEISKYLAISC